MPNGIAWTKEEIALLVEAVKTQESFDALAGGLGRTRIAVEAKANRLGLLKGAAETA